MHRRRLSSKMVATKSKVLSCSTPEHRQESPSRDSDSLCDSEAASPVPFLCTQDGAEGETDVVWNFYTPKSEHAPQSRLKNSTPHNKKPKKSTKLKLDEKVLPKRKPVKVIRNKTELFQDLLELNQNLHELMAKKSNGNAVTEKLNSGSEDDIFSDAGDSPKSVRANSRCLRRNVLSSKFSKPDTETAIESDDSMNECLIKASQVIEERLLNHEPTPPKRIRTESPVTLKGVKPGLNFTINNDSMDAILNCIKVGSPKTKLQKCDSSCITNDSFDSFVGNLNDSAMERLIQLPVKNNGNKTKLNYSTRNDWIVQDIIVQGGSPSSTRFFGRHNTMPESPTVTDINKPSTSGMAFGRYNSMPHDNNAGDSPIKCTQDEIKRKHQQAREKLLAKRLLPFTSTQQSLPAQLTQSIATKKNQFQPRVGSTNSIPITKPSTINNVQSNVPVKPQKESNNNTQQISSSNPMDIKLLIEKKRQEALMKLRRRQVSK